MSSGSIYSLPFTASTAASLPSSSVRATLPKSIFTSAGMPRLLASMAVCELDEPFLVTKAKTFDLSIFIVSPGVRSSAKMMTASSPSSVASALPVSFLMTLFDISSTSTDLAFI